MHALQAPKTRPDVKSAKKERSCTVPWSCIKEFLIKNFLPLGFLVSIIWMIVWPWPGEKVESWRVGYLPLYLLSAPGSHACHRPVRAEQIFSK